MFFQTNDRIINLKNVSNINILRERGRIIFNMNYNIEMVNDFDGFSKFISDYVYWDCLTEDNLNQNIETLENNEYFKKHFIKQVNGEGYININAISSVKFSDKKNRVIFNLSHPVTFKDYEGNERITSEFVYANCANLKAYKDYSEYVLKAIKGEG